MLDRVLMYFRAQERTKNMLEVLYKNHKKQSKHGRKKKNYVHIPVYKHRSHYACKNYTQKDIRD
jgi:hypothetical protein